MYSKKLWVGIISGALVACGGRATPEAQRPEVGVGAREPAASFSGPTVAERVVESRTSVRVEPLLGALRPEEPEPLTDEGILAERNAMDEKSLNSRVRHFAQSLSAEHALARARQAELLHRIGLAAVENDATIRISDEGRRTLELLKRTDGVDFDDAYTNVEVEQQADMFHALADELIPNAKNPYLLAQLRKLLPRIAANYHEALEVQMSLGARPVAKMSVHSASP
jgi:predicted outer membrane protein